MSNLPNLLFVMGIQGSGKGTQAQKIAEKFGYTLFDTGAELRKIAKCDTPLGKEVKEIIEAGKYVPSRCIKAVIGEFLKNNQGKKLLFDTPIRHTEQNENLRDIFDKFTVLHLELDEETAIKRLLQRRIDSETGEVFGADFQGDTNPKTGNPLIRRKDDTPEGIKSRIELSKKETLPLIERWEKEGYKTYHINTADSIDNVFKEIVKTLKN